MNADSQAPVSRNPSAAGPGRAQPELVVALDNCTPSEARALVDELAPAGVRWLKVGLELFTRAGPEFVTRLRSQGLHVFLDLKLHDIPNTVSQAVEAAAATGAELLTVHCSGGRRMLEAAATASRGSDLCVVGVTVLTSLEASEFADLCSRWGARDSSHVPRSLVALELARLASASGLSGIVSSVSDLRDGQIAAANWTQAPVFVTPGIRPAAAGQAALKKDDQASIATVEQAVLAGATHLVVGRPITAQAVGRRALAAMAILKTIKETYGLPTHP